MSLPLLRMFSLALTLAVCGAARAQSETPSDDPDVRADAVAPDRSASAAQAALDAQAKSVHEQLATITDGAERFRLLNDLSTAYRHAGRIPEALRVGDEIVEDTRIGPGRRSLRASDLALAWSLSRDYPRSQRYIARAKALAQQATPEELETLPREPSYAFLHAEAEIERSRNNRHDLALAKTRETSDLAWANFNDPALSEKRHRAAANELLNNVDFNVRLLVQNNRRQAALSYVAEIRQRIATRPDLQASPGQIASIGDAAAIALASQDDYDAALAAINASIAYYERSKTPEFENGYGIALRMRLMIALAMGRIGDYGKDADALLRGRAANQTLAGSFPGEEADSMAMASRGDWRNAVVTIGQAMERMRRSQGTESPFYKYEAAMQLLFMLDDPQHADLQTDIQRFVDRLVGDDAGWVDASYRGAYVEDGALSTSMASLMSPGASDSAVALAFRISEVLRSSSSQGALADGAARLAASDPKLRALIEQEQALRFEQNSSRRAFATAETRAERAAKQPNPDELVAKRQAAEVADKQKAFEASDAKLRQLRSQISAQFPVYRELISPNIPNAAKIGAALRPGEAYLNLYSAGSAGYAFLVQPGGKLTGMRLDAPRAQARATIAALRKPFDAGAPPEQEGDLGGFDLAASLAVYNAWIAPLQAQLQGVKTLYISAGGALANVPWNVLTTKPATTLADASWWTLQITPVQMPSASSLLLARAQSARGAKQPFEAFADPSFDGRDDGAAPAATTRAVRQPPLVRGTPSPSIDYRKLSPLPETLDEAQAIGATLNAGSGSVIHGVAASRSRVLKEDLSNVRVLDFATHGLLPGEVPGMQKAGLALAYEGQGLADSVLTIDDIVGLRLNADWVILSACNTGFASGAAGDSMSALSRGFFAAGAHTLLTTQWAVESQSAKELTVGVFKTLAANPSASKGDALAQTERDMIAGKYGALYRHPYFWGAYFVSGDAAR